VSPPEGSRIRSSSWATQTGLSPPSRSTVAVRVAWLEPSAGRLAGRTTTDTAAALRAAELGCEALLKATQVDGVYSADPAKTPNARRYEQLSYDDVLKQDLRIMDGAAIALARDNRIPIIVFSIKEQGGLAAVLQGKGSSTTIS